MIGLVFVLGFLIGTWIGWACGAHRQRIRYKGVLNTLYGTVGCLRTRP